MTIDNILYTGETTETEVAPGSLVRIDSSRGSYYSFPASPRSRVEAIDPEKLYLYLGHTSGVEMIRESREIMPWLGASGLDNRFCFLSHTGRILLIICTCIFVRQDGKKIWNAVSKITLADDVEL